MKRMRAEKGFTLIEFVVVIGVIGVLYATSMPMYRELFLRAKLAEMYGLLRAGQIALETGIADLDNDQDFYEDYLDDGGRGALKVILTKDGVNDELLLEKLTPGLSANMIKNQKDGLRLGLLWWPTAGYADNTIGSGEDWSTNMNSVIVVNCKYHWATVSLYRISTDDANADVGWGWTNPVYYSWSHSINDTLYSLYGCDGGGDDEDINPGSAGEGPADADVGDVDDIPIGGDGDGGDCEVGGKLGKIGGC